MAIDFPDSPSINDQFSFGDRTWEWDGNYWKAVSAVAPTGPTGPTGPQGAAPDVSAIAPVSPNEGDVWFNSEDGKAYFYYVDVDSSQWVEFATAGAPGSDGADGVDGATGPTGPTGPTGATGPEPGIGKSIAVAMIFG